jgi:hypothetical protein
MSADKLSTNDGPKHQQVIKRSEFIELYYEVEQRYPLFKLIKKSDLNMLIWIIYVNMLGLSSIYYNITRSVIFLDIILGIFTLQIVFVITHVMAHALFLEYDQHVPGNARCTWPIVYYYAFYHHHHSKIDNWVPCLSYYTPDGYRGVVVSHWHTYTFLASERIIIILLFVWINPLFAVYSYGYEIAVLLLPYAHGWQHIPHEKFSIFIRVIFTFLEKIYLVAGKEDHDSHHIHTHRTVYQDFSSSGLYMKYIDKMINYIWDKSYYEAIKTKRKLYDVLVEKLVYVKKMSVLFLLILLYHVY